MTGQYPCPCCGYQTFPKLPPGSWDICPVCFWEDAPNDDWGWGSNQVRLRQAQQNFLDFGACELDWVDDVRQPTPDEQRPPGWQTLKAQEKERKAVLIQTITDAFSEVLREDGVSLHQAEVIDDYGSAEEEAQARLLDTDTHWWEVPDEWIADFYTALSFLDPKGFRYYIPAYMIWTLNNYENTFSNSVDSTIYSFLLYAGLENWTHQRFGLLDEAQSEAVCQFLRHMVWLGNGYSDARSAQVALNEYWAQFCEGQC